MILQADFIFSSDLFISMKLEMGLSVRERKRDADHSKTKFYTKLLSRNLSFITLLQTILSLMGRLDQALGVILRNYICK